MSRIFLLTFVFCAAFISTAQNVKMSGANTFSMYLCADGTVYTWGKNDHGQMAITGGNPSTIFDVPTKIAATLGPVGSQIAFPKMKAVDAGTGSTAYAIDMTGRVWAWGEDTYGQMGSNTTLNNSNEVPRKVQMLGSDLTNVVAVSGGNTSAYALLDNGNVIAWGDNDKGQLGRGSINTTDYVTQIRTIDYSVKYVYTALNVRLSGIIQIEAFDYGCMALDEKGNVWTWGESGEGQLGRDDNGTYYAGKVLKYNSKTGSELGNIKKISAGDKHALALDNEGYLWSWGANWEGQIGRYFARWNCADRVSSSDLSTCINDPTTIRGSYYDIDTDTYNYVDPLTGLPVSVGGNYLRNVIDIAGGQASSIALLSDGTVVSWGGSVVHSASGVLGVGTIPNLPTRSGVPYSFCPRFVMTNATTKLSNIVSVSDGDGFYFVSDAMGKIWCWGTNYWYGSYAGLLGLGSTVTSNQPYAVLNPNLLTDCRTPCSSLSIIAPPIVCKNGTTYTLIGLPAGGVFSGSGMSGSVFNPAALNPGEYTITYTLNSVPAYCTKTTTVKIVVPPAAQPLARVLSITAATFNDAWPLDASIPSSTLGYYLQGIKSGWSAEDIYAYVDDRSQTATTPNLKVDGTMSNVAMFDWNTTANNTCYPNWRKINTITQVATGTGQTENKDIFNKYDAALYGYNDQLALAVAANAQYKEIAYDGFEEYVPNTPLTISKQLKNNLTLLNVLPTSNELNTSFNFEYEIIQAIDNVLTIEYSGRNILSLNGALVGVFGAGLLTNTNKQIQGYFKVVNAVVGASSNLLILTLDNTDFTYSGIWSGKINIPLVVNSSPFILIPSPQTQAPTVVTAFESVINRKAHSGVNFLRVKANTEIEQLRLQLIPLKKYIISAWVSSDQNDPLTFAETLKTRGIAVEFIDASGYKIAGTSFVFDPSDSPGNIIEGWQRIEGSFTVPANAVRFTLKFLTPDNTASYFDDLRIFPSDGNMKSYVYNNADYKLKATLDQNNYATYYYYDEQGALYLLKKETERGIQTIQEVFMHQTEINK